MTAKRGSTAESSSVALQGEKRIMNITRISRHGAGLFTIGAIAALAAGCGAGPVPTDSPVAGANAGSGAEQADVKVAAEPSGNKAQADDDQGNAGDNQGVEGSDRGVDGGDQGVDGNDQGKSGNSQGKSGDDQGEDGNDQGEDSSDQGEDEGNDDTNETPAPQPEAIPESWGGTVSAERFAPADASSYLAMVHRHGAGATDSMSAEQIENTEFFGSMDAQCDGDVQIGGAASSCTFIDAYDSGVTMFAQVRLVSTGFGNTALMIGVSGEDGAELVVAPGAELGLQSIEQQDLSAVTTEDLKGAAFGAVMMGYRMDGDIPEGMSISCELTDGGEHGLCEVTGTPDGGGDGTWYATAQSGYNGDKVAYLFTRLPQE